MSEPHWAVTADCRIEHHASVNSTNTLALERARAGDPGRLWIRAGEQTGGRGRHGRSWNSPPGNLYATRLVIAEPPPRRLTGLAFVAAVALHDALVSLLPSPVRFGPRLKWPNDLMVDGAKLAGILVEVDQVRAGCAAAIGMGVNIIDMPGDVPVASLRGLGADVAPHEVFEVVGTAFEARLAEWDDGAGFAAIRAAWLDRAMPTGTPTSVKVGAERIDGLFCGLAEDGALLVELGGGTVRRITAGEVVVAGDRA